MKNANDHHPLCIVVPTYNEKMNLIALVPKIEETLKNHHIDAAILIVDDNSPDHTGEFAEEFSKTNKNIFVIHRPGKLGLGSAYKDGFTYAREKIKSQAVIQMDADGSHDPAYIPAFLTKINQGYDVVVGSRNIPGGAVVGWNFKRKLTSSIANKMARRLAGIKIHDATSGYRAFNLQSLQKINLRQTGSQGFDFQIEMLFHTQKAKLTITEVPFTFIDRKEGKSKLSMKEIRSYMATCLSLTLRRLMLPRGH